MPHGSCFLWNPFLTWLHASADFLIFGAYAAISVMLARFLIQNPQLWLGRFTWISFGFIGFCGIGHAINAYNIWHSAYWVEGFFKVTIAVFSWAAFTALRLSLPKAKHLIEQSTKAEQYRLELESTATQLKDHVQILENSHTELERSNSELEEFAYIVSHDLRAPLRTVEGFLQILFPEQFQLKDFELEESDRAQLAADIVSEYRRLNEVIESILQWSRAGRSEEALEPVDAELALVLAVNALQKDLLDCGAALHNEPLPVVMGRSTQLQQVFQNLIANAIKFHLPNAIPHIQIYADKEEGWTVITVEDNGIGLDVEQFGTQIFGFRKRLHHSDEYEGSGIGLALCKKMVERCGGVIWVESTPGKGAKFRFKLRLYSKP
ncbi:hypothetical protein H6G00_01325 [Leptolyngbya sp. FACHB-541]|uniref:sensor histidine kinase n=1 Tax=Leptolyngbya sp. FACHB-541 TaxID=2692810 RepID=UPI0016835D7C|nr:ATP-binding protein [Leptolyngbya sp. FACHB-541]MBD1995271.1 hypothetical protein [Leptolyngbya sp. FACHB-541]